jgi:hypothetical protein
MASDSKSDRKLSLKRLNSGWYHFGGTLPASWSAMVIQLLLCAILIVHVETTSKSAFSNHFSHTAFAPAEKELDCLDLEMKLRVTLTQHDLVWLSCKLVRLEVKLELGRM